MTQQALAARLGISASYLNLIEHDQRSVTASLLIKLAEVLRVDLAALCAATRTPHWRVTERAELEHALASPNGGIEVVEAVISRHDRRELDETLRALAKEI